jgi:hypothetical protein
VRVSPLATAVSVREGASVDARMTAVPTMILAAAWDAAETRFLLKLPRSRADGEPVRRPWRASSLSPALENLASAGAGRSGLAPSPRRKRSDARQGRRSGRLSRSEIAPGAASSSGRPRTPRHQIPISPGSWRKNAGSLRAVIVRSRPPRMSEFLRFLETSMRLDARFHDFESGFLVAKRVRYSPNSGARRRGAFQETIGSSNPREGMNGAGAS